MKNLATFVGVCLVAALVGCASKQSTAVSPGAVEGKNCSASCAKSCTANSQTSPGAVSDANCAKQCPMSGSKSGEQVSPGAVGEGTAKTGCCKSKATSG